jgi:hypothetical protein
VKSSRPGFCARWVNSQTKKARRTRSRAARFSGEARLLRRGAADLTRGSAGHRGRVDAHLRVAYEAAQPGVELLLVLLRIRKDLISQRDFVFGSRLRLIQPDDVPAVLGFERLGHVADVFQRERGFFEFGQEPAILGEKSQAAAPGRAAGIVRAGFGSRGERRFAGRDVAANRLDLLFRVVVGKGLALGSEPGSGVVAIRTCDTLIWPVRSGA